MTDRGLAWSRRNRRLQWRRQGIVSIIAYLKQVYYSVFSFLVPCTLSSVHLFVVYPCCCDVPLEFRFPCLEQTTYIIDAANQTPPSPAEETPP